MNEQIGLLATGNEIVNGDIINSNGPRIARSLIDNGFSMGLGVSVSDNETEIVTALKFLLEHHSIIITIGGLGPTSDDRTRFALSQVVAKPLEFNDASWQRIIKRLQALNLTIPESNRYQAMFPQGAKIFTNEYGTADGCAIDFNNKTIFMLPGPPNECLGIFQQHVLPLMQQRFVHTNLKLKRWRLFGVSEGHIAEKINQAMQAFHSVAGYRVDHPYIEFKIEINHQDDIDILLQTIMPIIEPHFLADPYEKAVTVCQQLLKKQNTSLLIEDHATGGLLQTKLHLPSLYKKVFFHHADIAANNNSLKTNIQLKITGLSEYWQQESTSGTTQLNLEYVLNNTKNKIQLTLPYRKQRVLQYAVELICNEIIKIISND